MFDPFLLQKDFKQAGIPVLLGFHKAFGKFKSVISPNYHDGLIHPTLANAQKDNEYFD